MKKTLKLENGVNAYFNSYNLKAAIRSKKESLERSGEKFSLQSIQEDLADKTGISFSSIKHWCAGHNAPSDMDKVHDLANALGIDVDYLIDIDEEDNVDMNNTNISNIDYSSVKGTIRSIYTSMVSYIETFRLGTITNINGMNMKMMFVMLYGELMRTRLDIPKGVFDQLNSFASNYLQQLGAYLNYSEYIMTDESIEMPSNPDDYLKQYCEAFDCAPAAPWSDCLAMFVDTTNGDFERFSEAIKEQFIWDQDEMNGVLANEFIINAAYARLDEILKDYMIK